MGFEAIFFNVPGHGHVNPSLPLVSELTRRGHQIRYFITEGFRGKVEAVGAQVEIYQAIEDDYFTGRGLDGSRPQKVACQLLESTEEILPDLLEFVRRADPDYILFDGMCPWGYYAARASQTPAIASLALLPAFSLSPRTLLNRDMRKFMPAVLVRDFRLGLEAVRRARALGDKYGVAPLGPASFLSAEGDISLSYTSAEFQPSAGRVSRSVRFVGRTISEEPDVDPNLFDAVRGRPLVYISLGTLNNKNREFFNLCVQAFSGRDEFLMITTGGAFAPEAFGKLPENIAVHSWLPQVAVLKRAALFITHGGLSSIHDGLYFGVPLLLYPQQGEQMFNTLRVVKLGAGLRLSDRNLTAGSLLSLSQRLMTEPQYKKCAERLGQSFRDAGGMKKAVDLIEDLLNDDDFLPIP
jgi:MGT family glycosyltransferase